MLSKITEHILDSKSSSAVTLNSFSFELSTFWFDSTVSIYVSYRYTRLWACWSVAVAWWTFFVVFGVLEIV